MGLREDALNYHSKGRKGKIETGITKECKNQKDITLAYSPGVAEPCKEIARDPSLVYEYTAKGNLVAVVTNGTAVLGLGAIGPMAGKPVMEGKAVLFKMFADIDCYDIELNAKTPEEIISACRMLEPTFGGINLEDIKAPECFEVEEKLREELDIPVFHDDQHGTAIVSGAALLNACEITGRNISDVKCVVNGAGAAAIACAQMYINLGLKKENLILCDSKGVVYKGRTEGMNKYKERFENETRKRTLAEAIEGADFFCGLSVAGAVTKEMVSTMARDPIIFAMANPDPEISPMDIKSVRQDAIIATGRSDYPNQVNNVLGYPYIFRGTMDVLSRRINEEMKMAAVHAIAALAKEDIPESVTKSYANSSELGFGREYLIPKPFDPRLLLRVAPAVAKAAMDTKVSRKNIDLEQYVDQLESRLGILQSVTRKIKRNVVVANRTHGKKLKVVLPEGTSPKILKAAEIVRSEGICEPILIGNIEKIKQLIQEIKLEKQLAGVEIIDPSDDKRTEKYASLLLEKRARKGVTRMGAYELMTGDHHYFASMMVDSGEADAFCSGVHHNYGDTLRPALQIIGTKADKVLAGIYMLLWKDKSIFVADTTVNINSNAEQLAQIAIQTHDMAKIYLNELPRVAMLSFSNFGSTKHPESDKVCKATDIVKRLRPDIEIDGEMQADFALSSELLERSYGFSTLKGPANVLIFPDLTSGNIAYKLLSKLGGATSIGPILTGMKKPVNVLARNCDIEEIVNLITFTIHRVQNGM
ncbi:NADP-dependent malic enzyme [Silvanigrella paludirubra]|uniref:NADP-dependent malic enzyme n=1 Tax=Silvanigrella paludirubra TaxID=2499159 RepID=A0A6N6VS76_9BACT|nr:NADP-dependent malic enzyme [Silvanigrella paludirubra]KAB8038982.1 NADP-dependent malic enzyme [Silvanigrella paludirubra]